MSGRYRVFTDRNYAYFVTCTIVEWLPIFAHETYRQIALDSLAFIRAHKPVELNAFVVMPSHLHAILWPQEGGHLADVLRDFKRFTSRSISKEAARRKDSQFLDVFAAARQKGRAQDVSQYQVWQEGSHPEALYTAEFARQKLGYIHNNPVRGGLVAAPEDWPYSSARAYFCEEETYPPTDILQL